jgi:hypothetical protein
MAPGMPGYLTPPLAGKLEAPMKMYLVGKGLASVALAGAGASPAVGEA